MDPDVLLRIADDELILGWRDSEWTGIAPFLEEDVALSSIAQNEIGHARAPLVDRNPADDAEIDYGQDGNLGVGDLFERRPDLGLGHHAAPGTDRRTIVISSHSGASSSVCSPR